MITKERLKEAFDYDPVTGVFTWKIRTSNRTSVGSFAGNVFQKKYRQIALDGRSYLAHRMAWLYVYGSLPDCTIDHINGAERGDGIWNLRPATHAQNMQNERRARTSNGSGFLGVSRADAVSERWFARITVAGIVRHLGRYDTPQEAHAVYLQAKRQLHPFATICDPEVRA